ncbi:hypothetical protein [Streptomyces sp. NPDC056670]|uniref:hypothetical protein n=1 Tax=Streptomyces sp. NPDC056670 TaxID=3345904 RepID=UPI003692B0AA
MANVIPRIRHPYWATLGYEVHQTRTSLGHSQKKVAGAVGLSIRALAALESGFVPPDIADDLGRLSLSDLDAALGWKEGTSRALATKDLLQREPEPPLVQIRLTDNTGDRSSYPRAAWARLGKAIQTSRLALKMTKPVLGHAIQSTGKSVLRIEQGLIYGDPRTAPPGNYNSEKYLLKRLALLEMALEWEEGQARRILEGENR